VDIFENQGEIRLLTHFIYSYGMTETTSGVITQKVEGSVPGKFIVY
jgi:hypothetical protein